MGKAEKIQLAGPLASVFLDRGIVVIREGATITNLSYDDISKEKHFSH